MHPPIESERVKVHINGGNGSMGSPDLMEEVKGYHAHDLNMMHVVSNSAGIGPDWLVIRIERIDVRTLKPSLPNVDKS